MDSIIYYDEEGFELKFESGTSLVERDYYAQEYKNVNLVADKRNHCTSCSAHIGTPPSAEDNIQTHSILNVTQCAKCYRFYNSGEFEKGEDGSELHCRWCGQGGELYCCSECPYVFCKKCILRNLSSDGLKEVLSNDNWKCYACAPEILYPLRAQHWALVNFIKKQKKALNSRIMKGLSDPDAIAYHMKKDTSVCCPSKTTASKRQLAIGLDNDEDYCEIVNGENLNLSSSRKKKKFKANEKPKKHLQKEIKPEVYASPSVSKSDTPRKKAKSQVKKSRPTATATSSSNTPVSNEPSTEIACTPEFFSYFVDHSPETNGGQNYTATTTSKAKKRKTSATSNRKNAAIIDVDAYRFDSNPPAMSPLVMRNSLPQQMMLKMAAPKQVIQRQATHSIKSPVTNAVQPPMMPWIYPNTKVGRARAQLESEMFSAMEICQQIEGKVKKLSNSPTYKTANKMNDVKELYIHLTYLLTYTKDRVQWLQDKCMEDMRRLGFKNVEPLHSIVTVDDSDNENSLAKETSSEIAIVGLSASTENLECEVDINDMLQLHDEGDQFNAALPTLSSGKFIDKNGSDCDENEIDIVQPSHAIITLDDSDEENSPAKQTSSEIDVVGLSTPTENLECNVDINAMLQLHDEGDRLNDAVVASLWAANIDEAEEIPRPLPLENVHININDDKKLKSNVKIVLKRAEDEFPCLMKEPLLHLMNCLIRENRRRNWSQSNKKMDENETDDDEPCMRNTEKTNKKWDHKGHYRK